MKRRATTGIVLLALSHLVFANGPLAWAEEGSAGGTIGKQEKSVSGTEETDTPRRTSHPRRPVRAERERPSGSSCRSIAGTWSSWASSQFGHGDTHFNADGTMTHPASKGTWSCENGEYVHVWATFGRRGPYRLSANGRQMIKVKDGSVSFSRD